MLLLQASNISLISSLISCKIDWASCSKALASSNWLAKRWTPFWILLTLIGTKEDSNNCQGWWTVICFWPTWDWIWWISWISPKVLDTFPTELELICLALTNSCLNLASQFLVWCRSVCPSDSSSRRMRGRWTSSLYSNNASKSWETTVNKRKFSEIISFYSWWVVRTYFQ